MADPDLTAFDHVEAIRLARRCRPVPAGFIALGTLFLGGVLAAASTVWSYGPGHLIP